MYKYEIEQIVEKEKQIVEEYGFSNKQIKIIAKTKPLVFLFDEEYETNKTGIKAVQKVFVDDLGFTKHDVKLVVARYPPILSKSEEEIHQFFDFLKQQDVDKEQAMWCL